MQTLEKYIFTSVILVIRPESLFFVLKNRNLKHMYIEKQFSLFYNV